MQQQLTRRVFLEGAGLAAAAGTVTASVAAAQESAAGGKIKIVGIGCSPRAESTTAASVQACLDAAKAVDPDQY